MPISVFWCLETARCVHIHLPPRAALPCGHAAWWLCVLFLCTFSDDSRRQLFAVSTTSNHIARRTRLRLSHSARARPQPLKVRTHVCAHARAPCTRVDVAGVVHTTTTTTTTWRGRVATRSMWCRVLVSQGVAAIRWLTRPSGPPLPLACVRCCRSTRRTSMANQAWPSRTTKGVTLRRIRMTLLCTPTHARTPRSSAPARALTLPLSRTPSPACLGLFGHN
jgi:hypothetical protein